MNSKKVLIIGGGMAGLSAGAYLRMNGYETEIYELNAGPGGLCTSWQRGDYTVDLCIHWLVGSGSANSLYERWNELIDLEKIEIVDPEEYARVEDGEGNDIRIYTDVDRLEQELLAKAPEDAETIREFTGAIRRLTALDLPSGDPVNLWNKMKQMWKMLPFMGIFGKFMRITEREYAQRFSNPLLRKAIEHLFEPEMAVIFSMMTLAWMHKKTAGYPVGGSLRFAQRVYDRYVGLGGKAHFNARVEKILTENDRAVGIQLAGGEEHFGDYVVSAADGFSTIFRMLDGRYTSPRIEQFYSKRPTFPSLVLVALGVARTFEEGPISVLFPIPEPLYIDPQTTVDHLYVRVHSFDPTLAPAGKTLVTTFFETGAYQYWLDLQNSDPDRYRREKERIARAVIEAIDHRWGGVRERVEMTDVSTPATMISFTDNWKGSFEGWLLTPETGWTSLEHTLPGLGNFYMCGQWVAVGGGLPTVMMSGREVAQLICRHDGRPFTVTAPRVAEVV